VEPRGAARTGVGGFRVIEAPGRLPNPVPRPCYTPNMPERPEAHDEPPPFLGTWRRVYAAVLVYLCLIMLACYLFTRAYR
jgi:hypothetical protein